MCLKFSKSAFVNLSLSWIITSRTIGYIALHIYQQDHICKLVKFIWSRNYFLLYAGLGQQIK